MANQFFVMNTKTTKRYCGPKYYSNTPEVYELRVAKAVATKLNKKAEKLVWVVIETDAYHVQFPPKMVTRINMMSGLPYEEAEDTPSYCSPASEAFWSA
jgi:hypothetical protein